LRGRVPVHTGNGHTLGQRGGEQAHTITQSEMPMHTHAVQASAAAATQNVPANNMVLAQRAAEIYRPPSNLGAMISGTVTNAGGSQPHDNMQPYLTINFCIALQGIFPSPN
jgi:microcystin-dependent protein